MATISSHVLDSIIGDHAKWIRIECIKISADGGRKGLFNTVADEQGRISETVEAAQGEATRFELIFHSAEYFAKQPATPEAKQIMPEVVVRFIISSPDEKIHIPIMLAPHSYSTWWSA